MNKKKKLKKYYYYTLRSRVHALYNYVQHAVRGSSRNKLP